MSEPAWQSSEIVASGGYRPDGGLDGFEGWPEDRAASTASFAAMGMMLFETIALGYGRLSGLEMGPARAWMVSGGDHTAIVHGGQWTILDSKRAGFGPPIVITGELASLLERTGGVDAGELTPNGGLAGHRTTIGLSEELAATGARFVHRLTTVVGELAEIFSILVDSDWTPVSGWLYEGGDWVVAVGERRWVLARAGADRAELLRAVLT